MIVRQIVKLKNGETAYLTFEETASAVRIVAHNLQKKIIGECFFTNIKNKKVYDGKICHLFLIRVLHENYHKVGLGHALISCFENFCILNHCYEVQGVFHPFKGDAEHVKHFYISHGYSITQKENHLFLYKNLEKRQERYL